MLEIKDLDEHLIHLANHHSTSGKRGDICNSSYQFYSGKVSSWNIPEVKRQQLLNETYEMWSKIMTYEAAKYSNGSSTVSSVKGQPDKDNIILQLSSEFVFWFKETEDKFIKGDSTNEDETVCIRRIELCLSDKRYDPTPHLLQLAAINNRKFIEYFENLFSLYKWKKNSKIYKLYRKGEKNAKCC